MKPVHCIAVPDLLERDCVDWTIATGNEGCDCWKGTQLVDRLCYYWSKSRYVCEGRGGGRDQFVRYSSLTLDCRFGIFHCRTESTLVKNLSLWYLLVIQSSKNTHFLLIFFSSDYFSGFGNKLQKRIPELDFQSKHFWEVSISVSPSGICIHTSYFENLFSSLQSGLSTLTEIAF